jgi:Leucine-rich repeat (LRR) protein
MKRFYPSIWLVIAALCLLLVTNSYTLAAPPTFVDYATSEQLSAEERKTLRALFGRGGIDITKGITREAAGVLEKKILRGTGLAFGGKDQHETMSGPVNVLWSAEIKDITLIIYFPHLERISLDGNEDVDLSPLLKMPKLKGLSFRRVQKVDHKFVSKLKSLDYLDLRESGIEDLTPFRELTALKQLGISDTKVTRIWPLGTPILSQLTLLEAENVKLEDWEFLSVCEHLEQFIARGSNLADLTCLRNSPSLWTINVSGAKNIESLKGLEGVGKLRQIGFSGTAVSDLSPLAELTNLERIYGEETRISDLSPLAKLNKLRELVICDSKVKDLSVLQKAKNLELLNVRNTLVTDTEVESVTSLMTEHPNDKGDMISLNVLYGKPSRDGLGVETE